jgi:hypothetical protein
MRTRTSNPDNGPFFEFEGSFLNGETNREDTLYLSAAFVQDMLRAEGSPFVDPESELRDVGKRYDELLAEAADLNEQLMEASLRIEELESELSVARRGAFTSTTNAVYVADLANRVAEAMEARQAERFGAVEPVVVKPRGKKAE